MRTPGLTNDNDETQTKTLDRARPAGRKHDVLHCAECFLTSDLWKTVHTNNRDLKQQISHDSEPRDTERNQSGQTDATVSLHQRSRQLTVRSRTLRGFHCDTNTRASSPKVFLENRDRRLVLVFKDVNETNPWKTETIKLLNITQPVS